MVQYTYNCHIKTLNNKVIDMKELLLMHPRTDRVMTESEWIEYCLIRGDLFDKDDFYVVQWNPMTGEWEEAE